uniref:Uncharacterized protein n=1 Tax=Palpitomonas bilix TaxID=652834 RepID=A0A7S3G1U8_9EUKA
MEGIVRDFGLRAALQKHCGEIITLSNEMGVQRSLEPSTKLGSRELFIAAVREFPASNKVYKLDVLPLYHSFTPKTMGICLLKWAILSSAIVQAKHEKDQDVDEKQIQEEVMSKTLHAVYTETVVQTLKRVSERAVIHNLEPKWIAKLLKIPGASAVRKAAKFGRAEAAKKMLSTYTIAGLLTQDAIFTVDLVVHVGAILRSGSAEEKTLSNIAKTILRLLVGRVGALAGGACLASAGTLIKPGIGTFLGGTIGEIVGTIVLVYAVGLSGK